MTTTPNMNLDKPVPGTGGTDGPLWAQMLNAISDLIDVHDHSSGKGVKITPSGINISSDLEFNENDATELRSVRFADQSAVFALAADVGCAYMKDGEFYFRDESGNNVQITSGGLLNASALTTAVFPMVDKTADYTILAADTFAFLRMDATAGNRVVTLPSAAAVAAGRYYLIADGFGQCTSTRTITIQAAGSDSLGAAAGPSSITIESAYGAALVVRAENDTWYIFRTNQLASTTVHGQIKLAQDLGGTAHAPTVLHITGTGAAGHSEMAMRTLRFADTITTPLITQEEKAGATGETLTIAAQTAATNGGDLVLASGEGSGIATHGDVHVRVHDNDVISAIAAANPYVRLSGTGGVKFGESVTPTITQEARTTGGAGASISITAQSANSGGDGGNISLTAGNGTGGGDAGGVVILKGGTGTTPGNVRIDSSAGTTLLDAREVATGRNVLGLAGGVNATKMPANTGNGVVFLNNAATAPSDSGVDGVILYSQGGIFGFRNDVAASSRWSFPGNLTLTAPAVGAAAAPPATPEAYLSITHNGTTYKLAAYKG